VLNKTGSAWALGKRKVGLQRYGVSQDAGHLVESSVCFAEIFCFVGMQQIRTGSGCACGCLGSAAGDKAGE